MNERTSERKNVQFYLSEKLKAFTTSMFAHRALKQGKDTDEVNKREFIILFNI